MNHLLRPRIWPSFLASSGVPSTTLRTGSPCDVPFKYASESRGNAGRLPGTRRKRLRCAWHDQFRGLATAIHEISGLKKRHGEVMWGGQRPPSIRCAVHTLHKSVTPRRIKLCGRLLLISCFPHLATHCAHRMVDIVFFESVHPAIVKVNVAGHVVTAGGRAPEAALRTKYRI